MKFAECILLFFCYINFVTYNCYADMLLSNWMTETKSIHNKPLTKVIIPGSHDSGTYAFNIYSKIGKDNSIPTKLNAIAGIGGLISRYAKTQTLNITEQLECGIRYFDFRVVRKTVKKRKWKFKTEHTEFRLIHGLEGDKLDDVLKQLYDFTSNHPTEKIIIDLQHIHNFSNDSQVQELIDLIKRYLGTRLATKLKYDSSAKNLTINRMNRNNHAIILIGRSKQLNNINNDCLWTSQHLVSPWKDKQNISELEQELIKFDKHNENKFYVTQYVITPNPKMIARHPLRKLKTITQRTTHANLDNFLSKLDKEKMNIIMLDFVNENTSKEIISLNTKVHKTNVLTKRRNMSRSKKDTLTTR